jgi:Pyruvate/2-oxoacid:ferredoxin oxidoreductase delta subunit
MAVKIDFDKWSEDSQRSYSYGGSWLYGGPDPENYENVACRCIKCEQSFTFTAEEQKTAYEDRKEFVWKARKRCNGCQLELEELQKKNNEFQSAWNLRSDDLRFNAEFLNAWLAVLELIPLYGKRANTSTIDMLRKALHENI